MVMVADPARYAVRRDKTDIGDNSVERTSLKCEISWKIRGLRL